MSPTYADAPAGRPAYADAPLGPAGDKSAGGPSRSDAPLARLHRSAALRPWLAAALVFAGVLTAGVLPALTPDDENVGAELSRLAQALRADPSPRTYQHLARLADRYAESELSAQAYFALGMADFEAHRWGDARERFAAARASTLLGDYATLYLARAEMEQGALASAEKTLAEAPFTGSLLEETARLLEADLLLRLERAPAAVKLLEARADVWSRPAEILALGRAQWAAGETVRAAETLNYLYHNLPLSPQAEPANELLKKLRAELKSSFPEPSNEFRQMRAEKLWAAKAYRGARSSYLELSGRAPEPIRTTARLRATMALYLVGAQTSACGELAALGEVTGGSEADYHSLRARCALRARDDRAVETELGVLRTRFGQSDGYETALLAAADTVWVRGEKGRAADYYRRLVEAFPQGKSAPEADWKLTWLLYRQGQTAAAAQAMEEHLERFPDSPYLPRALYWRARLAVAAKQDALAERLLALLREFAPRDYTAQQGEILAAQLQGAPAGDEDPLPAWLAKLGNWPRPAPPPPLPPLLAQELKKAAALERLSLLELADEVLDRASEQQPHPDLYLAQARVALAEERYARATVLLNLAYPAYWRYRLEELPREAWEIMYPRPYWEVIEREARRESVDPNLVAALIRQESRFEAQAVSPAGALGLMQLMPGTARNLAGARVSRGRLFVPETNVRLGTHYLAVLLRRYNGSLEKAVAGYNAGGGRVDEWASDTYSDDAEFVESIPISQTREFVHSVLRNYRFYRDLYPSR